MSITSHYYGRTQNGEEIYQYILENAAGMRVAVIEYGCVITNIWVKDNTGELRDVALGYSKLEDYELGGVFGAFIGRYANRIEKSRFTLDGKTYELEPNNGPNHLHGTFAKKVYKGSIVDGSLVLRAVSPDGEDGFPGNLELTVRYTLTDENALVLDYTATTDAPTIINLTNHSYFNLEGQSSGSMLEQTLCLNASTFTDVNAETCPTGRILPVAGTPMDFTSGKPLGRDIDTGFSQTTMVGGGFDHCFVIDRDRGSSQSLCAWATSEKSGISMKMYTTQPGIQLYTGNFLQDCPTPGKGGVPLQKYSGFALETQHFPCSPSHPEFPTTILRAGKVFRANTTLRFFTGRQCGRL